jgi:hypothetical protein
MPAETPRLFALLIAADCYLPNELPEGSYPSLRGCVRDVQHVEDFLRRRLALPEDRLVRLTATNTGAAEPPEPPERRPTYENIVGAFQWLTRQAGRGDQVYIHYSGHGGRTPTLLPDVKGPKGLDETLVPIDIGSSSARYVRDIELAKLLREMVDRGILVTIVLDSCHSGGATRGLDVAERGVEFVDRTPRPTESLVASLQDLRACWRGETGEPAQGVTRNLATLAAPLGYTLLAACRPAESAYEYAFDGKERNGALTYWLLDALQQIGPDLIWKTVYDRVLAKVHSQFERQTPLLQGDPGGGVLGAERVQPEFATLVLSADTAAQRVTLATGQAAGVRKGAQFVLYPRGTQDLSRAETRTALVEVDQLGAAESGARVVQTFGGKPIEAGDQAVLVGAASVKLVRKVRLLRPDGSPAEPADVALERVKQALPGNGWVELTEAGQPPADFIVTLSADGSSYEICDRAGQPITNLRPALAANDPASAPRVVRRLVHLTKYRAVQELDNNDSTSPLKGKLVVELLALPDDFDPADKPEPKPYPAGGIPPTLKPGQWTCLRVTNNSAQVLNIAVLDLQPDWGVSQAFPTDQNLDFEPLDPKGEPLVIPLRAGLPEQYAEGADTLKVLATVGTTSFRALTLSALDQPAQPKGARGPQNPLEELVQAVAAEKPLTRTLSPSATPSREWAVAQVEVRIRR